jgi:uncharacterized membrane protein
MKKWYTSKTLFGAALASAAGIAGLLGYTVSPDEVANVEGALVSIISIVGGLIAAYGRIKATKEIK